MTLRHMAEAEKNKALGERHLAKQRAMSTELERDGHDTAQAKALLATLEDSQRLHEERLNLLKQELSE